MTKHGTKSLAELLASLSEADRKSLIASLNPRQARDLLYDWKFWARPSQLAPPGDWDTWLLLAGRGHGKTRTGAEWVREIATNGAARNIALVAPTARDARKTIVEGESGILAVSPPWFYPEWQPSRLLLTWPNGAVAHLYSAEEPERLRGPNHDAAWADELAAWKYLDETWDNLEMTLRAGKRPRRVVTTTPKPRKVIRDLIGEAGTVVTRGSTYDNAANLAPAFLARLKAKYEGTRIGRQELMAELIEEADGALWKLELIDRTRVRHAPELSRVVVAIDPAITAEAASDETGIVVAGLGTDGHGYVLDDLTGRYSPREWARIAIAAYRRHRADRIVAEVNKGGDMVEATIRAIDRDIPFQAVHASRGKRTRAEPIAALYEQEKIHHVGTFAALEGQLTYITAGIATVGAIGAYLAGDASAMDTAQLVVSALLGAFIRSGVASGQAAKN